MRPLRRKPARRREAAYEAMTRGVLVRVYPAFEAGESDAERGRFFWTYTIEIENHGTETVQLLTRRWIITDGKNRVNEVDGEGVVGEQPVLKSREAFRYTSGCPLMTPSGSMRGSYGMVLEDGDYFDAEIPEFSLHMPEAVRSVN